MKKKWEIKRPNPKVVSEIARTMKCSTVTATVLANRNFQSSRETAEFLSPSTAAMQSPFSMKDMDAAVERICEAISKGEKIAIFGDYDADGITATAVLYEFLQAAGVDPHCHIPHRIKEGYSLKPDHIHQFARQGDIRLLVTVDCGSTAHDAIELANSLGMQTIVTDHHQVTDTLPPAVAVLNPHRRDCDAGLEHLSGVGVAFFLVMALRKTLREAGFWRNRTEPNLKKLCDLVAVGTVADLVPLVKESRTLTRAGLAVINDRERPGIRALVDACRIHKKVIDSDDIAYRIAPRINAAGRVGDPRRAFDLLIEKDPQNARKIADELCRLNDIRQLTEQEILEDISRYLNDNPQALRARSLVLSHSGWHLGVLGIVAAKLVERYYRPVILVSEMDGIGKGSGRSIPTFDLFKGLEMCAHCLEGFGGHQMAAGITIQPGKIEAFSRAFEDVTLEKTDTEDFVPVVEIDCELDFQNITPRLLDELSALQPFGASNGEPLFLAKHVTIQYASTVGKNHLRMRLSQRNGKPETVMDAIQFNATPPPGMTEKPFQMIFRPRWNLWNGNKKPQLVVEGIRTMPDAPHTTR